METWLLVTEELTLLHPLSVTRCLPARPWALRLTESRVLASVGLGIIGVSRAGVQYRVDGTLREVILARPHDRAPKEASRRYPVDDVSLLQKSTPLLLWLWYQRHQIHADIDYTLHRVAYNQWFNAMWSMFT